jgi:hypothetical protein
MFRRECRLFLCARGLRTFVSGIFVGQPKDSVVSQRFNESLSLKLFEEFSIIVENARQYANQNLVLFNSSVVVAVHLSARSDELEMKFAILTTIGCIKSRNPAGQPPGRIETTQLPALSLLLQCGMSLPSRLLSEGRLRLLLPRPITLEQGEYLYE